MPKKPITASEMARRRWANTTAAERREFARWVGSQGGRPRSDAPRCPCGKMTAKRAAARRHKC